MHTFLNRGDKVSAPMHLFMLLLLILACCYNFVAYFILITLKCCGKAFRLAIIVSLVVVDCSKRALKLQRLNYFLDLTLR